MCGIGGMFAFGASAPSVDLTALERINRALERRGPDGTGTWRSSDSRVAMTHRRLAIIDLNERAAQPMADPSGRLVITFNGEIYNFHVIRDKLIADHAYTFRTESDTEVLLALYKLYGDNMVHHLRGMFAFAIWDEDNRRLFLARDPYGIKPLYYASEAGRFLFASQVKALQATGLISREADPAGIVSFHLFGSVSEPFTIFRAISACPAGSTMTVDGQGVSVRRYANLAERIAEAQPVEKPIGPLVASAVHDSVRSHLVADVEVGLFLSSGIDSGALLGLMRDAGQSRVRAITLGFDELLGTQDDEIPAARLVARTYGAEHHVHVVEREDFRAALPRILEDMDQPSIDGINSWFVAKAARDCGLKVVLSGLGGDELLAGYSTFQSVPRMRRVGNFMRSLPFIRIAARELLKMTAPRLLASNPKIAGIFEQNGGIAEAYLLRRSVLLPFELDGRLDSETVRAGLARLAPLEQLERSLEPFPSTTVGQLSALESSHYMRNQLLRDADWASMAHSLELRTPFVDWTLLQRIAPLMPRFTKGAGKRALANAPSIPLPDAIARRARTGFTVPMSRWLSSGSATRLGSRDWSTKIAEAFGLAP